MCAVIVYFLLSLFVWIRIFVYTCDSNPFYYLVFLQIVFIADYLLNVRNYEFEMGKGYYCMWRGAYGLININSSILCL